MSSFQSFDGVEIHFDEIGQYAPIVMLPGLGGTARMWGAPPSPVTDHFRLFLIDPRGIGRSQCAPEAVTMEAWAKDVIALLDSKGIERAHLLGASLGASVALRAALDAPDRVISLALITPAHRLTPHLKNFLTCVRNLAGKLPPRDFFHAYATLCLMAESVDRAPLLVEHFAGAFDEADIPALIHQCTVQIESGFDYGPALPNLKPPVLCLSAMRDNVTPIAYAEELQKAVPTAYSIRLKRSNHAPLLEEPYNILPTLTKFWREHTL